MSDTPWYKLSESERIQQVYALHTIKDFWDWWSDGEEKVMEVRIKDFARIKELAKELQIPYSPSGVYVWNDILLKEVIRRTRDVTLWFGINSRKRNWNQFGTKSFGGRDCNVKQIDVLFIDIDRVKKDGVATEEELEKCDQLANIILDKLSIQNWNKSYCKVCSGNGVQLLIKLDFPIKLSEQEYDSRTKSFTPNDSFDRLRVLIPKGIGFDILKFCNKYKEELGVEVDKACFNIGRVAALLQTKNYKYQGFTWRGVVQLEKGVNDGLSDYVLAKVDDIKLYREKNVFVKSKAITPSNRIKPGKIFEHPLAKLLTERELPHGGINNILWAQMKALLRDSGIDFASEEFRKFHKEVELKQKDNYPANIPDKNYTFNENTVNRWCIDNLYPLLFPAWANKTKKKDLGIDTILFEHVIKDTDEYTLNSERTILEDLDWFKKELSSDVSPGINGEKFLKFVRSCITKYGETRTRYYFENIMKKYLSYE